MTPALAGALLVLVYSLSTLSGMATAYLIINLIGSSSTKNKAVVVQVEAQAKDNSYTNFAAQSQALGVERAANIAAKAQIEVARIEAETAVTNLATEQARLELARLTQGPPA